MSLPRRIFAVFAETLSDGIAGICYSLPLVGKVVKPLSCISIYADWDFSPSDAKVWQEWLKASGKIDVGTLKVLCTRTDLRLVILSRPG